MKAIVTADWHFSAYSNDKVNSTTGFPERLNSLYLTIINLIEWAKLYEIKNIIVAGDIFHNKSIIYSRWINFVQKINPNNL